MGNLDEVRAVQVELDGADAIDRGDIIDREESKCSALRAALWMVGCGKCWYSEAILQEGEGHVEHYRPKKRLWGAKHSGYWWRAFDWRNLRLSHATSNKRMTDFITKQKAGKGSYFPLKDETQRANCKAQEKFEAPLLLDPITASDTFLIAFSPDSGAPVPRYDTADNEWLSRRASESISYYHLHDGTWNMKRYDLMCEVSTICDRLEEAACRIPRDDAEYFEVIDDLVRFLDPYAEFSSACLQIVVERGLVEHTSGGARISC